MLATPEVSTVCSVVYCDGYNNNQKCEFDGGDCCGLKYFQRIIALFNILIFLSNITILEMTSQSPKFTEDIVIL